MYKDIKDLYFISGLEPEFVKSSKGWSQFFFYIFQWKNHHFSYKQKIPKNKIHLLCWI
jgi:hypothetical protein